MKNNYKLSSRIKNLLSNLGSSKFTAKLIFLITGIGSTIWFLIRVIPKPQRAGYPCMKTAAPIMSGFVVYLVTLSGSVLFFKKAISKFKQAKYITSALSILVALVLFVAFNLKDADKVFSNNKEIAWVRGVLPEGPNNPMGTGFGVFPGRVAWVRDVNATNENCPNTIADSYVMPKNNNQKAINNLADKSILTIGGQSTIKDSWDAIFKSFNKKKTGNETGYTDGQTIFIKVNNGQAGWAINSDMSERGNNSATGVKNAAMANTTPATVLAYVRQLVDECGVPQNKIQIAEPMTHVYKSLYDLIHGSYPEVIVLDKENKTKYGRVTSSGWTKDAIIYSDKGSDMPDAISDALMNEMYNADYMINIAALKAHARGGVTLTAKQHFGSHGDHPGYGYGSFHLHAGLISTVDNDVLDKANWAAGITYDPEGDGTEMPASLGIHEHWNNNTDKQYSKNLDATNGKGIELISIVESVVGVERIKGIVSELKVFPNPCTTESTISFSLKNSASVEFYVVNMEGKKVYSIETIKKPMGTHMQKLNTSSLSKGNYIVVMKSNSNSYTETKTTKISIN